MENRMKEQSEALEKEIRTLPCKMQKALCWIINNIEFVDQMAEGKAMTEEEAGRFIRMAQEKGDDLLWALVLYKQSKDRVERKNTVKNNGTEK